MKRWVWLVAAGVLGASLEGWGYGGGGGDESRCPKPQFSDFQPPQGSEVAPGSPFSFRAWSVLPETIEVTVKGQKVKVEISRSGGGFLVSGTLPEELRATYARINIRGLGPGRCPGTGGWLLKIGE